MIIDFTGPAGVGKTLVAESLALRYRMVLLDGSAYDKDFEAI